MHRRGKLAIAALLFVLLGWLYIHTDRLPGSARKLEFSLASSARQAVTETGHDVWARVDVRGRDAVVRGVAPSEEARADVVSVVEAASGGVAAVRDETDLLRRAEPYTFHARLEGASLTLSGHAPDRPTRDAMAARAARVFAGSVDAEGVDVASGAPSNADWLGAVDFAVSQLVRLRAGELEIVDRSISITGEAASAEVGADVARQLLQAPYPFSGEAEIDAPDAPRPPAAEGGEVAPAAEDRPGPSGATLASAAGAPTTQSRDAGWAEPRGAETSIAACRSEFEELLGGEAIRFQFGEAEVAEASGELLDAAADAARRCNAFNLVIEGHTDPSGDPAFNIYLSEQRARAVQTALVRRGVDPSRLSAEGKGSSEPVAANDTASGRARNRRIEIEVVAPRESGP